MQRILVHIPIILINNRVVHWDVNNEVEHGSWFERTTGNPTILHDMFSAVRDADEDVVLFLNDYEMISGHQVAQVCVHLYFMLVTSACICWLVCLYVCVQDNTNF